jgi:acyl carrier protein
MTSSSRTPHGAAGHCPVCEAAVPLQPSHPYGHTACPQCGAMLWFRRGPAGFWFHDEQKVWPIRKKVQEIVGENLGVEPQRLTDSSLFIQDVGADTLDIVELVMELEEGFGITIPDEVAEKIMTVGDLVDYLARHVP